MSRMIVPLLLLVSAGCQTSPGFRLAWEFTLPPTQTNTATLNPMPAMPTTAYAVEATQGVPIYNRQYMTAPNPAAVEPAPIAPVPARRQMLPMPKESAPCQPTCRVVTAEGE